MIKDEDDDNEIECLSLDDGMLLIIVMMIRNRKLMEHDLQGYIGMPLLYFQLEGCHQ